MKSGGSKTKLKSKSRIWPGISEYPQIRVDWPSTACLHRTQHRRCPQKGFKWSGSITTENIWTQELQPFSTLTFMLIKFPVHSKSGPLSLTILHPHRHQWSGAMEELSGLIKEWHQADVKERCVTHMASSSAHHRTRQGEAGSRVHPRCIFLFDGNSAPRHVQMALEAKHKCCMKGDEFTLTFTENALWNKALKHLESVTSSHYTRPCWWGKC